MLRYIFLFSIIATPIIKCFADIKKVYIHSNQNTFKEELNDLNEHISAILTSHDFTIVNNNERNIIELKLDLFQKGSNFQMDLQKFEEGKLKSKTSLHRPNIGLIRESLFESIKQIFPEMSELKPPPNKPEIIRKIEKNISKKYWYIGSGITKSYNLNHESYLLNLAGGYAWDFSNYNFKAFWDGSFSTKSKNTSHFWSIGVSNNFYITENKFRPFIHSHAGLGEAIRYNLSGDENDSKRSFVFGLGLGGNLKVINENSIEFLIKYSFLTKENTVGIPRILNFQIGCYF